MIDLNSFMQFLLIRLIKSRNNSDLIRIRQRKVRRGGRSNKKNSQRGFDKWDLTRRLLRWNDVILVGFPFPLRLLVLSPFALNFFFFLFYFNTFFFVSSSKISGFCFDLGYTYSNLSIIQDITMFGHLLRLSRISTYLTDNYWKWLFIKSDTKRLAHLIIFSVLDNREVWHFLKTLRAVKNWQKPLQLLTYHNP